MGGNDNNVPVSGKAAGVWAAVAEVRASDFMD